MTFSVVSLYTWEIEEYASITTGNNQKYCFENSYLFTLHRYLFEESRPPSWSKIPALIYQMNYSVHSDYIMWVDADAAIMNHSLRIEQFIDPEYDFIFSRDSGNLNAGVFIIKNSEFALKSLQRINQMDQYINHPWWEQAAIMELYATDDEFKQRTMICDELSSNAMNYKGGDFIVHLAGVSHRERVDYFKSKL